MGGADFMPPPLGLAPPPRVPVPERWTLQTGLRVVAVPWCALPQVAVRIIVPAGSAADPADHPGTAALVGALLTEGTAALSPEALNAQVDLLGASLGVQVGHDFAEIDLFMLGETLVEGLRLMSDVVRTPSFPPAEIERIRAETLDSLEARNDEPANVADDRLAELVFGEEHPYGIPVSGTLTGVSTVSRDALVDFHARHYRPAGAVLLIAGDIDLAALPALLEELFRDWTGDAEPIVYPALPPRPTGAGEVIRIPWEDAAQGEIRFAGPGMRRESAEWIPAAVANYLLGGSTITGRLGANLREDKGWTYGIRSGFAAAVQPGGWVIETAVDAEVIDQAIAEVVIELERFVAERVTDEELRRAKDALILSLPRAFETPGRIVGRFGTVEAFGLPIDYWERFPEAVERVSDRDVQSSAERYFRPDRLARLVVGPA